MASNFNFGENLNIAEKNHNHKELYNNGREFILVPQLSHGELGVSPSDWSLYMKTWAKEICKRYPDKRFAIFYGPAQCGSVGMIRAMFYNTGMVNNEGLPEYGMVCFDTWDLNHQGYFTQYSWNYVK